MRDVGTDASGFGPFVQRLESRDGERRIPASGFAGPYAEHACALDQHVVGLGETNAASEADHQNPRAPCDAAHAFLEHFTADRIEHHIDATTIGNALHEIAKRLLARQDAVIGAARLRHCELFLARCHRDHVRAEHLADLDGREADAAAGALHQQRLARLDLRAIDQRMIGGAVRCEEGCTFGIVERGRQRHDVFGRHRHFIGVTAMA